jgi:hypothetical protein
MATAYHVWTDDGVAHGPMDRPSLIQWIQTGRVTRDTWIFSASNNQWLKAGDLPELQPLFPTAVRDIDTDIDQLRRMPIFAGMDRHQIVAFLHHMDRVDYPQFSHVVHKGDHGAAMYLVLEGELRALTIVDGSEATLTTIAPGETFGEISLLDQGPRSADVIANQDSVLLRISTATFQRLLREHPALALPLILALSRALVGRVRKLTQRHEDSVQFIRANLGSS